MEVNAIILAAGKGTRMKTELPKCAIPVGGIPMINHIINSLYASSIDNIYVVVGYKKEELMSVIKKDVTFVEQKEQLGTGHAIMCCEDLLKDKNGITLIFPGDMPLISKYHISDFIRFHTVNKNDLTIMTTIFDNPKGYGRIYKDYNGKVIGIIEESDASDEVKKIKEVNTGLYCIDNKLLFEALSKIDNHNSKNEYYLTDIVKVMSSSYRVSAFTVINDFQLTGINDIDTLVKVERILSIHKNNNA